ncbi:MAG: hypothetical protein WCO35_01265 [Candidatus Nomurabacteria bacterium]
MTLESDNNPKKDLNIKSDQELSLETLLSIKEEINSYRNKKITESSMSGLALRFLNKEEELDEKIFELNKKEKTKKLENLKNEAKELENNLNRSISEHESLSKEYDRLDGSGKDMSDLRKELYETGEERDRYDEEHALISLEIEKLEKEIKKEY